MASTSVSPPPESTQGPANRHAPTAVERQRLQLERLLKDPSKPAFVPSGPKEKTIRPPRDMMKNVQGSSAGAGSGEFHVYKASRRREYERLKLMDEASQKREASEEFEHKKRQWEEEANAKTAKNRAKRQKKKEKGKAKGAKEDGGVGEKAAYGTKVSESTPFKKRRLVGGQEIVFRKPGEEDDDPSEDEEVETGPKADEPQEDPSPLENATAPAVVDTSRIIIHDED